MKYSELSEKRKKSIGNKANAFAKEHYSQISFKLKPKVADKFRALAKAEKLSNTQFLETLLENYENKG